MPRLNSSREAKKTSKKIKEKFREERGTGAEVGSFVLSREQTTAQNVIRENTLTFITGPAGSGKTLATLDLFCKMYLQDLTKRIVVVRTPAESCGKDKIGFLPSDLSSKIEPHFASTKKILEDLLTKGRVEADLGKRIEFMIPNYMLGSTLDNALICIDEAQMLEPLVMKLVLERIGQNSLCVVLGDVTQVYSNDKGRNGLSDALKRFFPSTGNFPLVGSYKFPISSCMRSDIVKTVIKAYSGEAYAGPSE